MNKRFISLILILLTTTSVDCYSYKDVWETIKSYWPWSFKSDPIAQELVQQLTDTFVKFSSNNQQIPLDYCKKNQAFVEAINNIVASETFKNYIPTAQQVPTFAQNHEKNTACPVCEVDLANTIFLATAIVQSVHYKITKSNIQNFLNAIDLFLHQYDAPNA